MKTARGLIPILLVLLPLVAGLGCSPAEPADEPTTPAVEDGPMIGVEKFYLEFVLNHLQTVAEDLSILELLFSEPDFEDEYWQASVTTLLSRIELAHESIVPLEPTERLRPFQAASVGALGHAAAFVNALRDMLAEGQTVLTDEATQELVKTSEGFAEADRLLSEFLAAHPVPDELRDSPAAAS